MARTRLIAGIVLTLCMIGSANAGLFDHGPGIYQLPDSYADSVAELSVGKPPGLAALSSWVTSDYEPTEFSTNYYWCDFETLYVVQLFHTSSRAIVKAAIKATTPDGTVVASDNYSFVPDESGTHYVYFSQAFPPAGNYRISFKITQGSKVIGSQYWIEVLDGDSPDCSK